MSRPLGSMAPSPSINKPIGSLTQAYAEEVAPRISIMFEVMTIIFLLTPSEKDDKWLGKVRKKWLVVKPLFELFHIKTPIMALLNKILARIKKVREAIEQRKKAKESQTKSDNNA